MFLSAEVPGDSLDLLLPPWAQQLSLLSLLLIIIMAWVRGWVVTRTACEREVEAERRISDIWKSNYEGSNELNRQLTEALQPVLESNAAILKAVEAVQDRQSRQEAREERERWLREQRGTQG